MAAIPTLYRGIQMRSRLEAKWACVFDDFSWKWEYEAVDLAGWIPDFLIRKEGSVPLLVEVKPVLERPVELCEKYYRLAIPEGYHVLIVSTSPLDARGEHRLGWKAPADLNCRAKNVARDNWKEEKIVGLVRWDHGQGDYLTFEEFKLIWAHATNLVQWKSPRA